MSTWEAITWDVARAGGFTAYLLLTLSVAVGLALTLHWQSPRWPRIINSELHNFLALLSLIFTAVHVLAIWIDPFTHFGWSEMFIPFVSHYRPLWMALGIVALYLAIAIGISTWLRPLIGYRWWRRLHVLTLFSYALVTVHGITTGSDTRTWWGIGFYAGSVLLVGTLLWIRLSKPANAQSRAHPVIAAGTLLVMLVVALLTVLGPLQPGWNAIANNGHGSGGSNVAPVTPATLKQAATFTPPFTAAVQGRLTQTGPDANGNVTLHLDMTTSRGAQGTVQIVLQGQSVRGAGEDDGDGRGSVSISTSRVTLGTNSGRPLYVGSLTDLYGNDQWHMAALLAGTTEANGGHVRLQIDVQINDAGQISGTVAGQST